MRASFHCEWNPLTDLWQIASPSGHVLYESPCHNAVLEICQRLNQPWECEPAGAALADEMDDEVEFATAWDMPGEFVGVG